MQTPNKTRWFRGQLHTHSYWSDGRGFPEQVAATYKERGYHFLCLTDHNRFADDPDVWREVAEEEGPWPPKVSRAIFNTYLNAFGNASAETKTLGTSTHVRLKTYDEIKSRFEEPDRFLMMPGVETTLVLGAIHLHLNYLNLPLLLPNVRDVNLIKSVTDGSTVSDQVALNAFEAEEAARAAGLPHLLMLNHPFSFFCDILPQSLIDCPRVRFFEICNNGSKFPPAPETPNYTPEQFWDCVNAARAAAGQPLLYGIGSDDAHFYDSARIDEEGGVGDAWVMVRAAKLTPDHLLEAMHRGDFYASSGVLLDEVAFRPTERSLRVKVAAEPGVQYHIHFITTRRGFDPSVTYVKTSTEEKRPPRTLPIYSDDIGRTAEVVYGGEAVYQMAADDLYVRARIESDRPSKLTPHFHPRVQVAWTQPYPGDNGNATVH